MTGPPLRLVLLDRDGTIVAGPPPGQRYLQHPQEVVLLPGARRAIARLNSLGIAVAVVTNQRGVATGALTRQDVDDIHARVGELLAPVARIDAWFVCPHDEGQCECRKPAPGLVEAALAHFAVDPAEARIVGNAKSDLEAGAAAGVGGVGVGVDPSRAGVWVASLLDAVDRLMAGQP